MNYREFGKFKLVLLVQLNGNEIVILSSVACTLISTSRLSSISWLEQIIQHFNIGTFF